MPTRFALLDIDGTLLLSNDAHAEAWHRAFAESGYDVDVDRLRRMIGMGGDKLIAGAVPGLSEDREPGAAIAKRHKALFRSDYLPRVRPAPGARELLERLRGDGFRLVVATSAKGDELHALLQAAHVDDLIDEATTSDDAKRSKPDPDIVRSALERVHAPADASTLLGDTPYDIEAASKSGVRTVAVRCGGWNDDELAGAIAIYDDPADVLRNYDASPFGRAVAR
ncbi:MAG: HAD family hydrolase [Candidatus Eremiobacteraeota bacterium]|nr:HAD family hydrolase [Candidatus Eremiobacteraeota bacterium]